MCRLLPRDVASEHRETLSHAIKKVLLSQLISIPSSVSLLSAGLLTRRCCSQAMASAAKKPEAKSMLAADALCGAVALDAPKLFDEVRLAMAHIITSLVNMCQLNVLKIISMAHCFWRAIQSTIPCIGS